MELSNRTIRMNTVLKRALCYILATVLVISGMHMIPNASGIVNAAAIALPDTPGTVLSSGLYIVDENKNITNTDGAGLAVGAGAKVTIIISEGKTLTVKGSDGNGRKAGAAGIFVPSGATLIVVGSGKLVVTGGAGGTGENGAVGGTGSADELSMSGGKGGLGGRGAGGAGAAIGTFGGIGSDYSDLQTQDPSNAESIKGSDGKVGAQGFDSDESGTVYLLGNITVDATAGAAGTAGRGGAAGNHGEAVLSGEKYFYAGAGGGGGGGGRTMAAATIGSGAPGAGGGGTGGNGGHSKADDNTSAFPDGRGGAGGNKAGTVGASLSDGNAESGSGGNAGEMGTAGAAGKLYIGSHVSFSKELNNSSSYDVDGNSSEKVSLTLSEEKAFLKTNGIAYDTNVITYDIDISLYDEAGRRTPDSIKKATVNSDTLKKVAIPVEEGAVFAGYYTEETDGVQVFDKYGKLVNSVENYTDEDGNWLYPYDVNLYAHWASNYKIAFNTNADSVNSVGTSSLVVSNEAELENIIVPTRTDYIFAGYYDKEDYTETGAVKVYNADGTVNKGTTYVDSDGKWIYSKTKKTVNLYAVWTPVITSKNITAIYDEVGYDISDMFEAPVEYSLSTTEDGASIRGKYLVAVDKTGPIVVTATISAEKGIAETTKTAQLIVEEPEYPSKELIAARKVAQGRLSDYAEAKKSAEFSEAEEAAFNQVVADANDTIGEAEEDEIEDALKNGKIAVDEALETIKDIQEYYELIDDQLDDAEDLIDFVERLKEKASEEDIEIMEAEAVTVSERIKDLEFARAALEVAATIDEIKAKEELAEKAVDSAKSATKRLDGSSTAAYAHIEIADAEELLAVLRENPYASEDDIKAAEEKIEELENQLKTYKKAKAAMAAAKQALNDLDDTATDQQRAVAEAAVVLARNAVLEAVESVFDATYDLFWTTINAIENANEAEKKAIEEAENLEAAKELAKERYDAFFEIKRPADYREDQQNEMEEAKEAAYKAIDEAEDEEAVSAALAEAKKALNEIKTDAELFKEETEAATKAAAEKTAADTKEAKKAETAIAAIPENITTDNKDVIAAARAAYNALTNDQKKLLPTEVVTKLTKAEETLAVAQSKQAAAENSLANSLEMSLGLRVTQTGNKLTVKWGAVNGAEEYKIYAQYSNMEFDEPVATVKNGVTKRTLTKIDGKKLNNKKIIKVYVEGFTTVNGKSTSIGKTITAYVVGAKHPKFTNAKSVTVKSKKKLTLGVGKFSSIKAVTTLAKKNRKLSNEGAKQFRYYSSNEAVATVSSKGRIKAVGAGTCVIHVYAQNGLSKTIEVTVN